MLIAIIVLDPSEGDCRKQKKVLSTIILTLELRKSDLHLTGISLDEGVFFDFPYKSIRTMKLKKTQIGFCGNVIKIAIAAHLREAGREQVSRKGKFVAIDNMDVKIITEVCVPLGYDGC